MSWLMAPPRHPSYHLRPNKAIDRCLLIELLRAFEVVVNLKEHVYIGFGGPYLEDFRLLSATFPYLTMVSVERDGETYKRQKFHLCSRNMTIFHGKFEEYLSTQFPADRPTIVWADHTDFDRQCLAQASDMARKSTPGSILRVTVKGEDRAYSDLRIARWAQQLPPRRQKAFAEFRRNFLERMRIQDVAYDDRWFTWENFREENFPSLVAQMILSVLNSSCIRPKSFLPLQIVKYSDGTVMLSVTGLFCLESDRDRLRQHFETTCSWCNADPKRLNEIDVPVLTTKERLHLEEVLPSRNGDGEASLERLGYLIEGDLSKSMSSRRMRHYEEYYRLYPYFGRLIP